MYSIGRKNMGCLLEAREEAHAKKHIRMVADLQFVFQPHGVIGQVFQDLLNQSLRDLIMCPHVIPTCLPLYL